MVKVGAKTTCLHFNPWRTLKKTTEPVGIFGTMSQEPWHPGKGAKPDCIIQSTAGKCAPMQIIKQPEDDLPFRTKMKQKWSSFQMNYD